MSLSVSVCHHTIQRSGKINGLPRLRRIWLSSAAGSLVKTCRVSSPVQSTAPTSTGPTTLHALNLDAFLVSCSSENSLLRTSTLDAGSLMPGSYTSWPVAWAEVSVTLVPSWCTTTPFTLSHWSTTLTCSTGTWPRFSPETPLFPMLTESGEPDRPPSTTSTTEPLTDTDTESQDTFLGTAAWTSPLCPTWSTSAQRSSTEPSRETTTPFLNSSEESCYYCCVSFLWHSAQKRTLNLYESLECYYPLCHKQRSGKAI